MNRNLNILLWVVFFVLLAPSGMALASWNALPGDATYDMKISLEKVLLFALSPSNELQSTTNSKLTERRLGEVTRVLSGVHARESLDNLKMQIDSTRDSLYSIENEVAKKKAILKYIQTLHQISSELENQKLTRSLALRTPRQPLTSSGDPSPPPGTTATTQPQVTYVTNYYTQPQPPTVQQPVTIQPTQPTTIQPPVTIQPTQTTAPATQPLQSSSPQPTSTANESITPEVVENITVTQDKIDAVIEDLTDTAEEIEVTPSAAASATSPEKPSPKPSPSAEASPSPAEKTGGGAGQGRDKGRGGDR